MTRIIDFNAIEKRIKTLIIALQQRAGISREWRRKTRPFDKHYDANHDDDDDDNYCFYLL